MDSRPLEIAAFLDQHQWSEAVIHAFDGDFSPRRYARLIHKDGRSAILMDADADQKTPQFVALDRLLRSLNIAAPEIYGERAERGLVLMQDFGARNVGSLLDKGDGARPYFMQAVEILAQLHRSFDRTAAASLDLPLYTTELFVTQTELFLDAYFPFVKKREASAGERSDFRAAWTAVLRPVATMSQSLLLRDFMADNLMDLGQGRLGLLDFQDAGIGPAAYDVASLCEEVRRSGGFALLPEIIAHYRAATQSPLSQAEWVRACTILSAQRHTRILGILARLAIQKGRHDKLAFVPRIQQHLQNALREPFLLPVREWLERCDVA